MSLLVREWFKTEKSRSGRGIINQLSVKRGRLKRIATGLVCVFSAAASFAACTSTIPVDREKKDSQAVIVGTVVSSHLVPQSWDSLDGTEYVVHIDQKVKGKQTGEITIFAEHTDNGLNLQAGKQYLLLDRKSVV